MSWRQRTWLIHVTNKTTFIFQNQASCHFSDTADALIICKNQSINAFLRPPPMILFALLQDSAVSTSSLLSSFFFYVIQPLLVPCSPTSPVVFVSPLSVLSSFLLSVSPLFSSASFASFICYFSFFFVWSCSFSFFGFFIVLSAFPLPFSSSAAVLWWSGSAALCVKVYLLSF